MVISGEPHCREHRISETTFLLVYQARPKRDMLPPLKGVGFFLHRDEPTVVGLTVPPEAFYISVCPTAMGEMLRTCRTWLSPDKQQHVCYLKPFTPSRLPDGNRQGSVVNVQGANTCTKYTRRYALCIVYKRLKCSRGGTPVWSVFPPCAAVRLIPPLKHVGVRLTGFCNAALIRQLQDLPGAASGMATAMVGGCRSTGARS